MLRLLKLGRLVELVNPKRLSDIVASLLEPLGIHGVVSASPATFPEDKTVEH